MFECHLTHSPTGKLLYTVRMQAPEGSNVTRDDVYIAPGNLQFGVNVETRINDYNEKGWWAYFKD